MNTSVLAGCCYRRLTVFLHLKGLTWAFLDTKRAVRVLGSGVVLQLKRRWVVHKRLRALGHARPAVVEIGARLRRKHMTLVSRGRRAHRQMPAEVSFSCNVRLEGVSFRWHFGRCSCPSSLWTPNGRTIGPLIQGNDVNGKCFPINLLSVLWRHRLWRQ